MIKALSDELAGSRVTPWSHAVLLDFGLVTGVDPRGADWYALGACLFEALTGHLPFEGSSDLEMFLAKLPL